MNGIGADYEFRIVSQVKIDPIFQHERADQILFPATDQYLRARAESSRSIDRTLNRLRL
jgi:hypothetical protein